KVLDYSGRNDSRAVHLMFREKIAGVPQIKQVTFVGPDGHTIASSREYPARDIYLGDREWFTALRDSPITGDRIDKPVETRATGEWLILVSRRITWPDGSLA